MGEGEEMKVWLAEFETVNKENLVAVYDHRPSKKEMRALWLKEQHQWGNYPKGEHITVRGPFVIRTKEMIW